MQQYFLPRIGKAKIEEVLSSGDDARLFELLVAPLHEELYRRQSFDFLDDLSEGQRLFLSYDYILTQVSQGGFIQLFVNGYVGLLPDLPALMQQAQAYGMAQLLDDALKAYVAHNTIFQRDLSTQEFARLYDQLPEFPVLDAKFEQLNQPTLAALCSYARANMDAFVTVLSV